MRWRDVRILYLKELRTAVRERSIVINAVLVPIFLYPVLLWLMFSAFTFVEGLAEGFESRVAVLGDSTRAAPLVDSLRASENVRVVDEIEALAVAESAIQEGELDAVLELTSPSETEAGAGNVVVRIHYDRAEERSRRARDRLEHLGRADRRLRRGGGLRRSAERGHAGRPHGGRRDAAQPVCRLISWPCCAAPSPRRRWAPASGPGRSCAARRRARRRG